MVEDQIIGKINDHGGKMDQEQLVQSLGVEEDEVLHNVRDLIEDGKVAYSHDWQLMTQE